jgi:hypothetical protein
LDFLDFNAITHSYYELWLGEQGCLTENVNKNLFIYSSERNKIQPGYPSCLDLFAWIQSDKFIISYGEAAKTEINKVKERLSMFRSVSDIAHTLSNIFNCNITYGIKYVYKKLPHLDSNNAKTLVSSDFDDYKTFFCSCHPNVKDTDWLTEYFDGMAKYGYCVGVYINNLLVSCTDAPTMPYMSDKVQEIGINTFSDYRGKGYAATACIKAAKNIINSGKVPQWSTTIDNIASQKLAERVGFVKLSDVLSLTL